VGSLVVPGASGVGSSIFSEAFRWDQRVWITVIRLSLSPPPFPSASLVGRVWPCALVSCAPCVCSVERRACGALYARASRAGVPMLGRGWGALYLE